MRSCSSSLCATVALQAVVWYVWNLVTHMVKYYLSHWLLFSLFLVCTGDDHSLVSEASGAGLQVCERCANVKLCKNCLWLSIYYIKFVYILLIILLNFKCIGLHFRFLDLILGYNKFLVKKKNLLNLVGWSCKTSLNVNIFPTNKSSTL